MTPRHHTLTGPPRYDEMDEMRWDEMRSGDGGWGKETGCTGSELWRRCAPEGHSETKQVTTWSGETYRTVETTNGCGM